MLKKFFISILVVMILILLNVISSGTYESAYNKYLKGNIADAISEITKDVFNGTRDPRSYFLMIKILKENTRDYKQGIEYAIEGIRLFPDKEREFSLELGELYYLSGKYSQAEQVLLNYNEKYPGDPRCLYLLGRNYFSQGKFYKATASFESSISFGDRSVLTYEYLGKSYRKIGNYTKALELLSQVYNQTKKEELLGMIIEISSILDVDYSSYLSLKKTLVPKQIAKPTQTTSQQVSTTKLPVSFEKPVTPKAQDSEHSSDDRSTEIDQQEVETSN